jgi:hypothetical protein
VKKRLTIFASTLAIAAVGIAPAAAIASTPYVPAQFIAKQYTEALGRMPDQAGWQDAVSGFAKSGCTAGSLADFSKQIYTSAEFAGLKYSDPARLLALYRGTLNREPDRTRLADWTKQLASGTSWSTVVGDFVSSTGFTSLAPATCSGVVDGSGSSYYFGTPPPISIPTGSTGFTGTEKDLQDKLNAAAKAGGGTVSLAQSAVVALTGPLTIPTGVRLMTYGSPDNRHYANMGRLVRATSYAKPSTLDALVHVGKGATLSHIWVDGTRDTPDNTAPLEDVITYGTGVKVLGDRISNSQGPNSLYLFGGYNGYPCSQAAVTDNLVTAYSSDHYKTNDWTDGIADNCEHATITGNQVVDATDVAIVVYRNTATSGQSSVVQGNYVLSAGNSMYGGLGFDPLYENSLTNPVTFDFTGSSISQNTIWSGPDTHFDIGITDGSRAWFAGQPNITADTGTGASVTDNTTGTQTARVQTGVGINGMLKTTVTGNSLKFDHVTSGNCPKADYAAAITAGFASGTFNPTPTDVSFDGCI